MSYNSQINYVSLNGTTEKAINSDFNLLLHFLEIIVEVKRQKLCLTLAYPLTESRISPLIILGWSAVWSLQQTQVWEDIHVVLWSNCAVHHKRYQARRLVTFYPSSNLGLLTEFLWLESFQLQRSFLPTKCFILATSLKKVLQGKDYGYKIQIAYMVNATACTFSSKTVSRATPLCVLCMS